MITPIYKAMLLFFNFYFTQEFTFPFALPTFTYCSLKRIFYKASNAFFVCEFLFDPILLWVKFSTFRRKQILPFILYWVILYAHWVDFFFASSFILPNLAISSSNLASVT